MIYVSAIYSQTYEYIFHSMVVNLHYLTSYKYQLNLYLHFVYGIFGLSWWLSDKESASSGGDMGSIPGSGRSPGEGNGNPLQYSCLGNPMDRGAR